MTRIQLELAMGVGVFFFWVIYIHCIWRRFVVDFSFWSIYLLALVGTGDSAAFFYIRRKMEIPKAVLDGRLCLFFSRSNTTAYTIQYNVIRIIATSCI